MIIARVLIGGVALLLIAYVLVEAFETLVLPRRVQRRGHMAKRFYPAMWHGWLRMSERLPADWRDQWLSAFGPLSLLLLLMLWAGSEVFGFAGLHWALGVPLQSPEPTPHFGTYLYLSATTFITLGFGDVAPLSGVGRFIADVEAGIGFGFLAIVIGYLPVLYTAFSRREVEIMLMDARAGSPPSAGAFLQRIGGSRGFGDLRDLLRDFERWAAELQESHLSYPVLRFYRSQNARQSWLTTLTTILDTCAFLIAWVPNDQITWQARITFAIARHASVDLALTSDTSPTPPDSDRLPPERLFQLCDLLRAAGMELEPDTRAAAQRLGELRELYEPFVNALSRSLELPLPSWLPNPDVPDHWQTSVWDKTDCFFTAGLHEPMGSDRFQKPQ